MKYLNLIISIIMILASIVLCQQIISNSISNQKNKLDYAEVNHVKYGLFSVDEWKRQIANILTDQINKLYLSKTDKSSLKKHIEDQLSSLIDEVDQKIRERNSGSIKGWFKQTFINIFVSIKNIKKGIPEYADSIVKEMTKSKNTNEIKTIMNIQLKLYIAQTFDIEDRSHLNSILDRTHSPDIESAKKILKKLISHDEDLIYKKATLLIILSVILFSLSSLSSNPLVPSLYITLILSLLILLVAGVTIPMIDMEAKISQMSFVLMEHPIHFENQVLYFQSKSILDVFWIMITNKSIQMKFVGVLVVTFSIFFPVLKILSTLVYYYNFHQARENRLIRFFVLKAGKWSMADVMVIAIFMAYIGFNGIITAQFGQLSSLGQDLVILTTNGTTLQPGYYLFITYVLLSLFLSGFLTRKPTS